MHPWQCLWLVFLVCPYWQLDCGYSHQLSVSISLFRVWRKVVLQGRADRASSGTQWWVTSFHIEYSINGYEWIKYNRGKVFKGNTDRNTQVEYDLVPFRARSIRLVMHSWNSWPCFRFGAFFEDENKNCWWYLIKCEINIYHSSS